MNYKQQEPSDELKSLIKSFWQIDSGSDTTISIEKIIPDGYAEYIIHYKDPYKANINGEWYQQEDTLIAGQIRNHFHLQNTGAIGMFGIKLQPWTLKAFFNLDMSKLTDSIIAIDKLNFYELNPIAKIAKSDISFEEKVALVEKWFLNNLLPTKKSIISDGYKATQMIISNNGKLTIQEVLKKVGISERSLERYFKTHVGLSPKFYCRIIRFSNIFNLVKSKGFEWSDITYLSGFYDQSHFIKNFKEFTGEEPSKYGFDEKTMANFFLKK